jgi:flagellar export protein FliJ
MVFRFRAKPALELRRRQDETAQGELAAAQAAERRAVDAVAAAEGSLRAALTRSLEVEAAPTDAATRGWHRNWITGQRQELAGLKVQLTEREAETLAAGDRARAARRRFRSLERLRDRAWRAFQHESSRIERRDMDMLANLRYVAQRRLEGGSE